MVKNRRLKIKVKGKGLSYRRLFRLKGVSGINVETTRKNGCHDAKLVLDDITRVRLG